MYTVLDSIDALTPDIKSFWLKTEAKVAYMSGQYIEMTLPHIRPDNRGIKHWFTLSSSPTEKLISITTKFSTPGSTFKQTLLNLKVGSKIHISEPMGDFVLPKDKSIPLVFVAGGIGVTPFRSIVKWLSDEGEKRSIQVIIAINRLEDLVFEKLFKDYGVKVTLVLTDPPNHWIGETGHLSAERILSLVEVNDKSLVYVSGPEAMVENLEADFIKSGLAREKFVGDFFPGYQPI